MDFRPELSWEFQSADDIHNRTIRALRNQVHHAKDTSIYYRDALADVFAQEIQSIEEFQKLPFTDKSILADMPMQFLGVSPEEIAETVVTSGSTGKPLLFSLTNNDIDRLAYNEALAFHSIGINSHDRSLLMVSLDRMFIAGMAYYRGLHMLGVNTARFGVVPAEMQKQYMSLFKPTVVVGVPSFMLKLAKQLETLGFNTRESSIEKIVCIGESLRDQNLEYNAVAQKLIELYDAQIFSTYASTEMATAYCDCAARSGGHARPELIFTEIIDQSGKPLPDGEVGELVVTPFGVEGVPLVRYKTGDITFKIPGICSCGRNSCRIGPILARKSQMIKVKGTTIYPLSITNALDELTDLTDYVIVLEGDESLADQVSIHVAAPASKLETIARHVQARTRVYFPILISNAPTINALRGNSHKQVKVVDSRKKMR